MHNFTIETERLILRPIRIEDAQDVFEWASDPEVNKYMPYPLHDNIHKAEEWINSLAGQNQFVFCLKESREVVGGGSMTYREEFEAYELGYNLKRKHWGYGYATEASKAMINWAYETLDAHDFFARHANENYASGNVIKKCGFQFVQFGTLEKVDGSDVFEASYYRLHINPWQKINLSDYENHMSLESVYQLQVLNQMMQAQFTDYDIETIMILGVAGGNGLEHIDKNKIKKVYGVDVNPDFLAECERRYHELQGVLETICADLSDANLKFPHSELLVANLLVEYIGYECFQKVVKLVGPSYVSCIIQINTGESFVSDSPYLHAFDCLEQVHHQMAENELIDCMSKINYRMIHTQEQLLPNGKKFIRLDFAG